MAMPSPDDPLTSASALLVALAAAAPAAVLPPVAAGLQQCVSVSPSLAGEEPSATCISLKI